MLKARSQALYERLIDKNDTKDFKELEGSNCPGRFYFLALCYEEGLSVSQDLEKATDLYLIFLNQVQRVLSSEAAIFLGCLSILAQSLTKDSKKSEAFFQIAKEFLREAAEANEPEAMFKLGKLYSKNNDITAACYWYLRAAKSKNENIAKDAFNEIYRLNSDFSNNPAVSATYLICKENAYGSNARKNPYVYHWWRKIANDSSSPWADVANFNLGIANEFGSAVGITLDLIQNFQSAKDFYKKAAESKSPEIRKLANKQLKTLPHHARLFTGKCEHKSDYEIPGFQRKIKFD